MAFFVCVNWKLKNLVFVISSYIEHGNMFLINIILYFLGKYLHFNIYFFMKTDVPFFHVYFLLLLFLIFIFYWASADRPLGHCVKKIMLFLCFSYEDLMLFCIILVGSCRATAYKSCMNSAVKKKKHKRWARQTECRFYDDLVFLLLVTALTAGSCLCHCYSASLKWCKNGIKNKIRVR